MRRYDSGDRAPQACNYRIRRMILIYADYDVDGTTDVAILKNGDELWEAEDDFQLPHRLKKVTNPKDDVNRSAC